MYTMSVEFVGDCTSLVNAANNSMAAIRRADGMSATMGISAPGAPSVIQQLTSVGDLQRSISGVSTVDVKVGAGVGALQGELRATQSMAKDLGNELKAAGGTGIGGSSAVSKLVGELGGATQEATQFAGTMSRVQAAVGAMDTRMVSQNMQSIAASATELSQNAGALEKQLVPVGARMEQAAVAANAQGQATRAAAAEVRGYQSAVEGLSDANSGGLYSSDAISRQTSAVRAGTSALQDQSSALKDSAGDFSAWEGEVSKGAYTWGNFKEDFNGGVLQGLPSEVQRGPRGLMQRVREDVAGDMGIPIVGTHDFNPPGGGGGGGGGGGFGGFSRGSFGEPNRMMDAALSPSLSGLAMPAMLLAAGGIVGGAAAVAAGLLGVNEVVKNTPGLMLEANRAMNSFNDGVRSASHGALAEGVPAFQQLGRSLEPLGAAMGRVGTSEMGTVLGGISDLAVHATAAVNNLAPAIDPALKGAFTLGNALVDGLGSPAVAAGVADLGRAAQNPATAAAVTQLTSSVVGGGAELLSKLGPVIQAVNAFGSGQVAADTSGGSMVYNPAQDYGGAPTPGGGGGVSWNQGSWFGRAMTALGATGSLVGTTTADILNGSILGERGSDAQQQAANQLHTQGDEFNARWGNLFNEGRYTPPSAAAGPSRSGADMFGQVSRGYQPEPGAPSSLVPITAGKYGTIQDAQGNYTPAYTPQGPLAPQTGSPVFKPQQTLPGGPGSSVLSVSATQANQLNAAIQQSQPIAQNSASALSVFGQSAMSSASQVQQLGQSSVSTFSLLGDTSTSATQQLSSASSAITSGSQALGSSVPQAMSQGITANTGAACDATANLGANAVNCAKSALDAHSPSRKFVDLGMGTGEGFALGVNDSAGLAASSVAQSMNGAIAAASGALNSNSPSKAFQNLAANAFGQNVGGQFQNQAVSQLNSVYGQQTQASLAQSQIQARNEEERAKQEAVQARAQASAAQASRGGLTNQQLQQLPPDVQAALRAGVPLNDAQRQSLGYDSWRQQRGDALDKFHWSDHTKTDVLNREEARKERADQRHLEGRDPESLHANAKARLNSPWGHEQANKMREEGNLAGHSWGNGTADGIRNSTGKIGSSAADAANHGTDQLKKKAGVSSPSTVWAQVGGFMTDGLALGISNGFGSISQSIAPIASNTGLMVGYVFGENMVNGTLSVIKSADYQTAAVTGIGSKLAETALGQLGMLGPAGSGASIPKNAAITLTASGAASGTTPIVNATINVQVGDQPVRDVAHQVVDAELTGLTTAITMQG